MVTKSDIVTTFNEVFNSNKLYAELDEFEKLYGLIVLLINKGTTSNNGGEETLVDIIRLRDKTVEANQLAIDGTGKVGINNLPTDYSKSSDITALATALNNILTDLNNKADLSETQPVSLTTIPLATNAASETTLGNINTKLPSTLGSKTAANSLAVTLSSDGIFATAFGTATDISATTDTANTGFISLTKRLLEKLTAGIGLLVNGTSVSLSNPLPIHRTSRSLAGTNYATATNAAATVTYAAVAGQSNIISGIMFSYSATPTAGSITVTDGATTVLSADIISGGAGFIPFDAPVRGSTNTPLTITLSAGGTGVIGKVSVFSKWNEA